MNMEKTDQIFIKKGIYSYLSNAVLIKSNLSASIIQNRIHFMSKTYTQ